MNLILPLPHYSQAKEMSHPLLPREACASILSLVAQWQGSLTDGSPFHREPALSTGQEHALISVGNKSSAKHYVIPQPFLAELPSHGHYVCATGGQSCHEPLGTAMARCAGAGMDGARVIWGPRHEAEPGAAEPRQETSLVFYTLLIQTVSRVGVLCCLIRGLSSLCCLFL